MDEKKYHREVQTRERLIQTFIIISGLLLAYEKGSMYYLFSLFILFAILYYVFLTRSKLRYWIDFFAFFSSYMFSLMVLHFIDLNSNLGDINFIRTFIFLTAICTFAFLSPETSNKLVTKTKMELEIFYNRHEKIAKIILKIIAIIVIIIVLYQTIYFYLNK